MRTGSPLATFSMLVLPQHAWIGTPGAYPVGGIEADIQSITRDDVLAFVERTYQPQNIVLTVSGDLPENLARLLDEQFNYYTKTRPASLIPVATRIYQDQPQNYLLTNGTNDALVVLAFPYNTPELEQYIDVISYCLIDTMSSRLFKVLRGQLGLIYSVTSLNQQLIDTGLFGFCFSTKNQGTNVQACIDATMNILNDVALHGLTTTELDQAKAFLVESKLLALEDSMTLAQYYGHNLLLKDRVLPYNQYLDKLRNLTNDDIRYGASELFSISRLNLAIIN